MTENSGSGRAFLLGAGVALVTVLLTWGADELQKRRQISSAPWASDLFLLERFETIVHEFPPGVVVDQLSQTSFFEMNHDDLVDRYIDNYSFLTRRSFKDPRVEAQRDSLTSVMAEARSALAVARMVESGTSTRTTLTTGEFQRIVSSIEALHSSADSILDLGILTLDHKVIR